MLTLLVLRFCVVFSHTVGCTEFFLFHFDVLSVDGARECGVHESVGCTRVWGARECGVHESVDGVGVDVVSVDVAGVDNFGVEIVGVDVVGVTFLMLCRSPSATP